MFNCHTHGWQSYDRSCPECYRPHYTSDTKLRMHNSDLVQNFKTELDRENNIMNLTYDLNTQVAKTMAESIDKEIMNCLTPEQLAMSDKVRRLILVLEWVKDWADGEDVSVYDQADEAILEFHQEQKKGVQHGKQKLQAD